MNFFKGNSSCIDLTHNASVCNEQFWSELLDETLSDLNLSDTDVRFAGDGFACLFIDGNFTDDGNSTNGNDTDYDDCFVKALKFYMYVLTFGN